jgi:hypothetical protein
MSVPFLNVGTGALIGTDLVLALKELGWEGLRLEQGETEEDTFLIATEAVELGMEALVIVFQSNHVGPALDAGAMVEVENEPTIGRDPGMRYPRDKMTPAQYASFAEECLNKAPGGKIWIGSIHTLNRDCLRWLEETLMRIEGGHYGISYHRYTNGPDIHTPQPGMKSREHEMQELRRVASGRPIARTECGRHTAPESRRYGFLNLRKESWQLTDTQVAEDNAKEILFDTNWGVELTTIYQINDGPNDVALDRYGIRRYDTFDDWKLSAFRHHD